jgi:hypothetical protein
MTTPNQFQAPVFPAAGAMTAARRRREAPMIIIQSLQLPSLFRTEHAAVIL